MDKLGAAQAPRRGGTPALVKAMTVRGDKSLRFSDRSVQDMAASLECNRNTIGNWLNDRAKCSPSNMKLWAQEIC